MSSDSAAHVEVTFAKLGSNSKRLLSAGVSWGFVLPAIAVYGFVIVYPMIAGTGFAFTDWDGLSNDRSFVGLENFRRLASDPQARASISTTLVMAGSLLVAKIVIGLLLALALNTQIRTRNFLRMIFFMPVVLTPVIMSFVWRYIFSSNGALNQLLEAAGLGNWEQQWLGDPGWALFCVIFVTSWSQVGLAMVIFLAGLQKVPEELIEAAKIDGAGPVRRLWSVILPMLAPAMTVNVVIALITGLKFFDQIYVLTAGGPGYATETMSTIIYKTSFQFGEFGYGSSIALVFAIIVATIVYSATYLLKKREIEHV
ncbi:carbohydrate ABC transporter permease [Pseudoruegeria sp. HB172150]|uniref:carbohydrate ABC transporter permease n=1 Tax=Pseudoruegeria sp. HB172150 TaxID=2721164 RepID=UPI001555A606|nr:sugar ABC transporter permease [Pseudoruegeria sp. HB172150]